MDPTQPKTSRISALLLYVCAIATACSGGGPDGGNGGNNGGNGGGNNTGLVGGIRAAADSARGPVVTDILAVGDRYEMETDPVAEQDAIRELWRVLSTPARWVAPSNPLYTYQFYEDPSFMPGPLFRYTGFEVNVGGIVLKTIGRYWAADGRGPFLAASLHTWDHNPEFLVAASDTQIAHATEHFNGMPTTLQYQAATR